MTRTREHYQVAELRLGLAPTHRISIWLGAYRPRMLRLTGQLPDNVMALDGAPPAWPDQLARISDRLRFDTLIVGAPATDPVGFARRLGEETAPAARAFLG